MTRLRALSALPVAPHGYLIKDLWEGILVIALGRDDGGNSTAPRPAGRGAVELLGLFERREVQAGPGCSCPVWKR